MRILIAFLAILGGCSPTLAETLNSFRHAHGLPALHRNGALQAMAQRHARSMALRRAIDHSEFYSERGRSGARAENVAAGCGSESCIIALWAASPGHRQNMLLTDVRGYGLASAAGGGERYWCLIYGPIDRWPVIGQNLKKVPLVSRLMHKSIIRRQILGPAADLYPRTAALRI